jgi:oxygen-independent coproporphyrinogen-3 oxidase
MSTEIQFDADLIRRYDGSGPRYTSYPTALQFHEGFGVADLDRAAAASEADRPLSLYFHLPFCATLCFYCACNKVVTKNRAHAGPYLDHLQDEIVMQSRRFEGRPRVDQLHWGGGTPTFLDDGRIEWLVERIREVYPLRDDDGGDYAVELDPRAVGPDTIGLLRRLGFNRASLGVQDLDERVQRAVNRVQPESLTRSTIESARAAGFRSINVDLIYGLPHQSVASFTRTLDRIIELGPDRLAIYNYAHLPDRFPPQRRIRSEDLPGADEKLAILQRAIEHLTAAGYVHIGMDHFAKPGDELARAQREGTLTRNFQGYSTHGDCDIVAHGISAISMVGDCYSQNVRDREPYYAALSEGRLPVARGVTLNADDRLRRDVITRLTCDFEVDTAAIGTRHGIDFEDYFAAELADLDAMAADGLVERVPGRVRITPAGRLLVRNVCMAFDHYLRDDAPRAYSRVI